MSGATIVFTQKPAGRYYTLDEINDLFANIATVLNQKLDVRAPASTANTFINGQRIINLAPATDPDDVPTLGQLKQLLGIE